MEYNLGLWLPNLTTSGGEAVRQAGPGALPVTSISFPDTLDQQPQTDFKYWFWLVSIDDLIVECTDPSPISGHLVCEGKQF